MMTFGAIIDGGVWLPTIKTDPVVVDMYLRHYSAKKNVHSNDYGVRRARYENGVAGAGESMTLRSVDGRAVWIWLFNTVERLDKQVGVNCTIFRNEGPWLSSDLVHEADLIAWQRWADHLRHFTYIGDDQIKSVNPGYCFKKAGWTTAGRSKSGLTLLENNREAT